MAHSPEDDHESEFGHDGETSQDVREEIRLPREYAVVLHNDHYTTMEFVIEVLTSIFRLTPDKANAVMLSVHESGKGVAGVYRLEIAETKAMQVQERARARSYPLRCTVEPLAGPSGEDA